MRWATWATGSMQARDLAWGVSPLPPSPFPLNPNQPLDYALGKADRPCARHKLARPAHQRTRADWRGKR